MVLFVKKPQGCGAEVLQESGWAIAVLARAAVADRILNNILKHRPITVLEGCVWLMLGLQPIDRSLSLSI